MTDASLAGIPQLVPNGIDIDTGSYLTPGVSVAQLADALRGGAFDPTSVRDLRRRRLSDEDHLGVVWGRNPQKLTSVGWGVVVPDGFDHAFIEALEPLLRLREEQAGELFRRLELLPGEDKDAFLARHGMGPAVVDPRRMPYYLMLLGTPDQVPFEVQYQLGASYAVGRLDLEDAAAYAAYAAKVVAAEASVDAPIGDGYDPVRRLHFFATRNPGDLATALSASRLVEPLDAELRSSTAAWDVTNHIGETATRARLEDLLLGGCAPDVLFTASHGVGGRSTGREVSGALLCQDWPGPLAARGPLDETYYLAAEHLPTGARIGPKVIFSFACFGAGTPRVSEYPGGPDGTGQLAEAGFTARLPQRMLGAPAGGPLAFVGHVDRAWSCSFVWKGITAQVTPFFSTLLALTDGARLGWAMESLTQRSGELASMLTDRIDEFRRRGLQVDDAELVGLWTATKDARAHVVLGDPAVRVAPMGSARLDAS